MKSEILGETRQVESCRLGRWVNISGRREDGLGDTFKDQKGRWVRRSKKNLGGLQRDVMMPNLGWSVTA
jgi:hypothetical protein